MQSIDGNGGHAVCVTSFMLRSYCGIRSGLRIRYRLSPRFRFKIRLSVVTQFSTDESFLQKFIQSRTTARGSVQFRPITFHSIFKYFSSDSGGDGTVVSHDNKRKIATLENKIKTISINRVGP